MSSGAYCGCRMCSTMSPILLQANFKGYSAGRTDATTVPFFARVTFSDVVLTHRGTSD